MFQRLILLKLVRPATLIPDAGEASCLVVAAGGVQVEGPTGCAGAVSRRDQTHYSAGTVRGPECLVAKIVHL